MKPSLALLAALVASPLPASAQTPTLSPGALQTLIRLVRASEAAETCNLRSRDWVATQQGALALTITASYPERMGAGVFIGLMLAARQEAESPSAERCASLPALLDALEQITRPMLGAPRP